MYKDIQIKLYSLLNFVFVHDGIENCVEDYSSRVGVGCRVSPNLNMGLFTNALSYRAGIVYGAFL